MSIHVPIKYDTTGPNTPTAVTVLSSYIYAFVLQIKFSSVAVGKRWTKIYWATTTKTAAQVHNAPENLDEVCVIETTSNTEKDIIFNCKDSRRNNIKIPWNTQGYFNVINYDQTYLDEYGKKNPVALRNYSAVISTTQFYSAAEYIDVSNLKIQYIIDYTNSNKVNILLAFTGYNNGANITTLRITCKQKTTGLYYNSAGTEGTAYEDFIPPNGFGTYLIKYILPYDNGLQTYLFGFASANQDGIFSGRTILDTYNTQALEEKIKKSTWSEPELIDKSYKVYGYRKKAALYISDINVKEERCQKSGNFISKPYILQKPLYGVQLYSSEIFDFLETFPTNPELYIKYYLRFLENGNWYRISPIHRRNETWINTNDRYNNNLKYVPKILILDTNLSDDEQLKNIIAKNTAYINLNKEIYSIRIKINFDTSMIDNNFISPKVADYSIKSITRDILKSNILEEDLGNA